jgi:hypothetical protein
VLAALVSWAEFLVYAKRPWRIGFGSVLVGLIAFGCIVNLALGISGPYWEMIKNKPLRFVRIAGWFSPVEKYRPVLTPRLDFSFSAAVQSGPDHVRKDWLSAGRVPNRYEVYVENVAGKPRMFSSYPGATASCELEGNGKPATFRVSYSPELAEVWVTKDGMELLRHKMGPLVAAPSQIVLTSGNS